MFGLSLVFDSGRKFLLKKNPIAQILKNKAQLSQTGRKSRLLSRTKKSKRGQVFVNNRRSVVNVWEMRS